MSNRDSPVEVNMTRFGAALLALILAVGCGGGGGNSGNNNNNNNNPGGDPIAPADASQLGGGLSSSATLLAAQSPLNALTSQAGALALQAGVRSNPVTLTAFAPRVRNGRRCPAARRGPSGSSSRS